MIGKALLLNAALSYKLMITERWKRKADFYKEIPIKETVVFSETCKISQVATVEKDLACFSVSFIGS